MNITLICVGKIKNDFLGSAYQEYVKRLKNYCRLEIIEVDDEKIPDNASEAEKQIIKKKEALKISKHLEKNESYVIVLAIEGIQQSSEQFAEMISNKMTAGVSSFTFIIGGSLGLDYNSLTNCGFKLSFSKMTLPHQLMRVVLLEQIYRCMKINSGEPYHK